MKYLSYLVVFFLFFVACAEDKPVQDESTEVQTETSQSGQDVLQNLREKALDENDRSGRLKASLKPIQEAFSASEAAMPDLEGVEVSIDDDCILRIVNHANGNIETRVDLNHLDPKGFSLVPDATPDEFPGVRVQTLESAPLVEIYRNGELYTKDNEIVIKLKDRSAVERVTPVLLQTMMICRGDI
ncbi:MAG: hypothetical protein GYB31_11285 [Bacteroidetes bacterium]|nr:hypothetical protein [Bacteroidota bacterium]